MRPWPRPAPTAREGELTKEGYEFWKDYVNAHGGLKVGGKTYKVDIKYADDESNPQRRRGWSKSSSRKTT